MQSQKLQQLKKNKFESYEDVAAGFKTINSNPLLQAVVLVIWL
jgi:hypothetical protein